MVNTTTRNETQVLSASTMIGDKVINRQGESLGDIKELMIDMDSGRVAYAVLSFGGVMGMGDKLFAIPFQSLQLRPDHHDFVLDIDKDRLKKAPGFDKNNWPSTADRKWGAQIHEFYGQRPYWETSSTSRV
ncbi:MAG TPA: PRC-barrel domain-containing protein [Thermoanaerobaculia bacterium]|nr:PRC-barrel domain-containing protein [Thermoanaerobaculia bacterium]